MVVVVLRVVVVDFFVVEAFVVDSFVVTGRVLGRVVVVVVGSATVEVLASQHPCTMNFSHAKTLYPHYAHCFSSLICIIPD